MLCEVSDVVVLTAFSVRLVLLVLEVLAVCCSLLFFVVLCCALLCFVVLVLVVPLGLVLLAALALIPVLVKMRVSYWQL